MTWFEEQIAERQTRDNAKVRDANLKLTSIVMGNKVFDQMLEANEDAEGEIMKFYGVTSLEQLTKRSIKLTSKWYTDSIGALLAETEQGGIVALIPGKQGGYTYYDNRLGRRVKVDSRAPLTGKAVCFYRQLPDKSLSLTDLLKFVLGALSKRDVFLFFLFLLFSVLMGLFLPYINEAIFGRVIPSGSYAMLGCISALLACVLVATALVGVCSTLLGSRISTKIDTAISPALYMRLLSLPVSFYKQYDSGELAERSAAIKNMVDLFFGSILSTFVTFLFSLVYLFQVDRLANELKTVVVLVLVMILTISLINTFVSVQSTKKSMKASAKLSGLQFHLISGIQKIKLTGSEKRAYAKWAERFAEKAKYTYNPHLLIKIGPALNTAVSMLGTLFFFAIGTKNHITPVEYMAFSVAYGLLSSSVLSLGNIVSAAAQLRPNYLMAEPILKNIPENYSEKEILQGGIQHIEFSHVSFRYNNDTPYIFSDLNLKIHPGEYLAIVGKTGCGKSTLVRLLLGFEAPTDGSIYVNGINMQEIDCKSLRRKMGVVMQTSKLFLGDIFSNISVTNPDMTQDEAWKIARLVGMEIDIKRMPMGMHTLITEGGGGLSGGQRQRLVIARAIASKPSLLLFDEATSALDNVTQKQVSDALDSLQCTRVVIAHRLSTIRHCDRIIVIEDGRIVEEGTFEQLLDHKGYFAALIKRQMCTNRER